MNSGANGVVIGLKRMAHRSSTAILVAGVAACKQHNWNWVAERDMTSVSILHSHMRDVERRWAGRIERARLLQEKHPAFKGALRLYEVTLQVQFEVALGAVSSTKPEATLQMQIDIAFAISKLRSILAVAQKAGPVTLRTRADALWKEGEAAWRGYFASAVEGNWKLPNKMDDYFFRACLQPIAENLQCQMAPNPNYSESCCPACGGLPQLSVLRPEGEGASRFLVCSFCLREWLFRRLICPYCGQEDKEKLPRYSAQGCTYVYVEACDTCMQYLKAVDLTIDGRAEPLVDEAAWVVLDLWASDHGYTKIIPNLLGF